MYSHVLGSQFSSISATSILVMERTLVVDVLAIYIGARYVHIIGLMYNDNGMYCTFYDACRCRYMHVCTGQVCTRNRFGVC